MQKITQRNTWDLKLIDHLSALVQGDDDEDDQTNFQKASVLRCFRDASSEVGNNVTAIEFYFLK